MSNFQRLPASTAGDLTSAIETFAEMRQGSVQASVVSLSAARPSFSPATTEGEQLGL